MVLISVTSLEWYECISYFDMDGKHFGEKHQFASIICVEALKKCHFTKYVINLQIIRWFLGGEIWLKHNYMFLWRYALANCRSCSSKLMKLIFEMIQILLNRWKKLAIRIAMKIFEEITKTVNRKYMNVHCTRTLMTGFQFWAFQIKVIYAHTFRT